MRLLNNIHLKILLFTTFFIVYLLLFDQTNSFWSTDTSFYFRCATDCEQLKFTSPAIHGTITKSPTIFLQISQFLVANGFDPENPIHYSVLNIFFYLISALSVLYSLKNLLAMYTKDHFYILLSFLFLLFCPLIFNNGRMHTLNNVITNGFVSMVANSFTILAISLFITGNKRISYILLGVTTFLHAVTPLLGIIVVGVIDCFELFRSKNRKQDLKSFGLSVLSFIVLSTPLFINILLNKIPALGDVSFESFKGFVSHRSTNPMPLRDGISVFSSQILVFVTSLYFVVASKTSSVFKNRTLITISVIAFFYLSQVVFSELVSIDLFFTVIMHRLAPMAMLIFLMITIIRIKELSSNFQLLALIMILILSFDMFFKIRLFDPYLRRSNFAATIFILGCIGIVNNKKLFKRYIITALPLLAFVFIGDLGSVWINESFFNASFISFKKLLISFFQKKNHFLQISTFVAVIFLLRKIMFKNFKLNLRYVSVLLFLILLFSEFLPELRKNRKLKNYLLPPYKNQVLLNFIKVNVKKNEVIHITGPYIDLNGVRRVYLDFKHEWYAIYHKPSLKNLLQRLDAIEAYTDDRSYGHMECDNGKWLLIERCYLYRSQILHKISHHKHWRKHVTKMKSLVPGLKKVLIATREAEDSDKIIASFAGYSLLDITHL